MDFVIMKETVLVGKTLMFIIMGKRAHFNGFVIQSLKGILDVLLLLVPTTF